MERKSSRNTIMLMLMFILALIIGLAGVVLVIINILNNGGLTSSATSEESPTVQPTKAAVYQVTSIDSPKGRETDKEYNYNFSLNAGTPQINYSPLGKLAKFATTNIIPDMSKISRMQIKEIGVDVPIIQEIKGEEALQKGWWMYPASEDGGEKIILAHRRYWKRGSSYSAWDMNKLQIGSIIKVYDSEGRVFKYKVKSQAIRDGVDRSIFRASQGEDLLKIITCSTWNGDPGSPDYRFITIAQRV